jgi:hypothetical protein
MAHRGFIYPVLWRRDLSVNSSLSWIRCASDFYVDWQLVVGPFPGTVYQSTREELNLITDVHDNNPIWETAVLSQHGRSFTLRLVWSFDGISTGDLLPKFQIMNGGVVRLEVNVHWNASGNYAYWGSPITIVTPTIYDAAFWGGDFLGVTAVGAPKLWADY